MAEQAPTPEQTEVLRHTLGIRGRGRARVDRNHFVTGEGSSDHPICMSLVEAGLMVRRRGNALSGGDDIFHATAAGEAAVGLLRAAKESA